MQEIFRVLPLLWVLAPKPNPALNGAESVVGVETATAARWQPRLTHHCPRQPRPGFTYPASQVHRGLTLQRRTRIIRDVGHL